MDDFEYHLEVSELVDDVARIVVTVEGARIELTWDRDHQDNAVALAIAFEDILANNAAPFGRGEIEVLEKPDWTEELF